MKRFYCNICNALLFFGDNCNVKIKCSRCGHINMIRYKPPKETAVMPKHETRGDDKNFIDITS
jgi:phage FluMu protein Com